MQPLDIREGFEFSSDLLPCRRNKLLNPIIPLNPPPPRLLSIAANQGFSGTRREEHRVSLSLCRLPLLYKICLLTGPARVLYLFVYFTC